MRVFNEQTKYLAVKKVFSQNGIYKIVIQICFPKYLYTINVFQAFEVTMAKTDQAGLHPTWMVKQCVQ